MLVFLPDVYPSFCSSAAAVSSSGNGLVSRWALLMIKCHSTAAGGRQLCGEPLLTLPCFRPCIKQSVEAPFLWGGFGPCQLWNHIRYVLVIGDRILFNIQIVATRKI